MRHIQVRNLLHKFGISDVQRWIILEDTDEEAIKVQNIKCFEHSKRIKELKWQMTNKLAVYWK